MPFLAIGGLPVFCNVLWPSREAALASPRGDIRLGLCSACGMIRNLAFDPTLAAYSPAYENSLHSSPAFQAYARELAGRLRQTYGLRGKDVIDIGSGRGEFLTLLCDGAGNRGVGFDPSYDGEPGGDGPVTFVRDYFTDAHADVPADFITCRHVLEHVESPMELLSAVRRAARARRATVYFEVPDGGYMLRESAIWDVIYEHPSYFTASSLRRLFDRAGFRILDLGTSFGGQYLWIEAAWADDEDRRNGTARNQEGFARLASGFAAAYPRAVGLWSERLASWKRDGKRVALWGVGSKGVTFANVVAGGADIDAAVDLNVRKHGRYVPGTGHEVTSPESLGSLRPQIVLVMNPMYLEEIRGRIAGLGLGAEVVPV